MERQRSVGVRMFGEGDVVTQLMRVLVLGVAAFNLLLGLTFLIVPQRIAPAFHGIPDGVAGFATIRADFGAFFLCGAAFAAVGAWQAERAPLRVSLVLLGIALGGRLIGVALDGMVSTTLAPMLAEFAMISVLGLAYRQFGTEKRRPQHQGRIHEPGQGGAGGAF